MCITCLCYTKYVDHYCFFPSNSQTLILALVKNPVSLMHVCGVNQQQLDFASALCSKIHLAVETTLYVWIWRLSHPAHYLCWWPGPWEQAAERCNPLAVCTWLSVTADIQFSPPPGT